MPILTAPDFPAVRAAIDLSLDATVVPDATIALPIFQGLAETQVLARDPLAAGRVDPDLTHIKNAAIYLTAALLVASLPQIIQEDFAKDYRYVKQPVDREALAALLRARADDEIDAVLDPNGLSSERPSMFALGHGTRGG